MSSPSSIKCKCLSPQHCDYTCFICEQTSTSYMTFFQLSENCQIHMSDNDNGEPLFICGKCSRDGWSSKHDDIKKYYAINTKTNESKLSQMAIGWK